MQEPPHTVHPAITGHVQGVFYRESMRRAATEFGVAGWVRNRDDGSVEAMVQGMKHDVDRLVTWCHVGPPHARIDAVAARVIESGVVYAGFETRTHR